MDQFETFIYQAGISAQQQDWLKTIDFLNQALRLNPDHPGALSSLGTCMLNMGRVSESIPYFEKAASLTPYQSEAKNNLGVAYSVIGDLTKAEIVLKEAIQINGNDSQAWKNLAQVYLQQSDRLADGLQILASIVQSNPSDTDTLLQLALCYEIGGDIESAKNILDRVLTLQPNHDQARRVLDDINAKIDATHIARPEHAAKLAGLKSLIHTKPSPTPQSQPVEGISPVSPTPLPIISKLPVKMEKTINAAFYAPGEFSGLQRLASIKSFFEKKGIYIQPMLSFSPQHLDEYESVIFYNANLNPHLIEAIKVCIQKGKKYYLDIDTDFHNLPMDHPSYTQFGPGNPNGLRMVEILLQNAFLITTASETLAQRLKMYAPQVEVALPAWMNTDPWWDRPSPSRDMVQIGWLGTKADLPDLLTIKAPVTRLLNEKPHTTWVAAGCDEAYDIFSKISEDRRLFLPPPTGDSLAFLLTNIDIMLVPLRDNPYNQAKSDLPLLYAGIRRTPWLASPIQAFVNWSEGGILAKTQDDWYSELRKLVENADIRKKLGESGRKKANERCLQLT